MRNYHYVFQFRLVYSLCYTHIISVVIKGDEKNLKNRKAKSNTYVLLASMTRFNKKFLDELEATKTGDKCVQKALQIASGHIKEEPESPISNSTTITPKVASKEKGLAKLLRKKAVER